MLEQILTARSSPPLRGLDRVRPAGDGTWGLPETMHAAWGALFRGAPRSRRVLAALALSSQHWRFVAALARPRSIDAVVAALVLSSQHKPLVLPCGVKNVFGPASAPF